MTLPTKQSHDVVTILASAARTVTGVGASVRLPRFVNALGFTLDVTNAAVAAADTLDVTIQTKLMGGTTWVDVVHFTQILGNGADALTYTAKIVAQIAQAEFETGAALGAAAVRHLIGDEWRASWTIVDDTGPAFTFSVLAMPM